MNDSQEFSHLAEVDIEDTSPECEATTKRSTWVSVVVNIALTISQVVAGIWSGSQGLIADGVHSLSDLVADFVVLLAIQHSQKEADADHHYGHQRDENAPHRPIISPVQYLAKAAKILNFSKCIFQ